MANYENNDARLGADIKDLEPSPGEGKVGGGTENPLVTETKDLGRGTPVQTVVAPKFGDKVEQAVVNFLNGIKIKGKNLEDYIDSEGGVTEAELQAALANCLDVIDIADENTGKSFYELGISDKVLGGKCIIRGYVDGENTEYIPINISDDYTTYFRISGFNLSDRYIAGYFYNVEADDISLSDMYSYEENFNVPKVVANPTLAGDEDVITGLQIGDTKYKVGGGTKLYKHTLAGALKDEYDNDLGLYVINTTPTAIPFMGNTDQVIQTSLMAVCTYGFTRKILSYGSGAAYYFSSSGTINSTTCTAGSWTDTVTEL